MKAKSKKVLDEFIEKCMLTIADEFDGRHRELSRKEMLLKLVATAGNFQEISDATGIPIQEVIGYFDKFDISDFHTEIPPDLTAPAYICTTSEPQPDEDYLIRRRIL